jgi:predicted enzyme related to lactoylglutathione lyase
MANPVTWFEIIGTDPIKLQKFYADTFGWKLSPPVPEMGNYSMLQPEGHGIGGGIGGNMGGPGRVSVYVEVDDPQAYLDKVTRNGGQMVMPVTQITPDTTIAMFTDPEGHIIGLLKSGSM